MPLSAPLSEQLSEALSHHCGTLVRIRDEVPVGGGSINDCFRVDTDGGSFFLKVNAADRYPSLFEAEADGLRRLAATGVVRVPNVIAFGEEDGLSYLLLEHIRTEPRSRAFWIALGNTVAALHRNPSPTFGLERNNYIGTLPQTNRPCTTWSEFYITQRLEPQLRAARNSNRLGDGDALRFEQLLSNIHLLFPAEAPSLLHGDLWNGNILCGANGEPVLIDPAVYYGHREMDLAMTRLFGGFDEAFHDAYNAALPLEAGWKERIDLCNLYPLLVHANLFGSSYIQQVRNILRRFT